MKTRNPVAKFQGINRAVTMVDRKKAMKRGKTKHKINYK